jgi:hypothetical protein
MAKPAAKIMVFSRNMLPPLFGYPAYSQWLRVTQEIK